MQKTGPMNDHETTHDLLCLDWPNGHNHTYCYTLCVVVGILIKSFTCWQWHQDHPRINWLMLFSGIERVLDWVAPHSNWWLLKDANSLTTSRDVTSQYSTTHSTYYFELASWCLAWSTSKWTILQSMSMLTPVYVHDHDHADLKFKISSYYY